MGSVKRDRPGASATMARASAGVSGWKLEMNRPVADMSFSVCLS